MLFYGASFVATSAALQSVGPITLLAARLVVSSAFLVVLDWLLPSQPEEAAWPRLADLGPILLITLFQPVLYFLSENTGMRTVSPAIASIIIATIPVFTPIAARLLFRESFPLLGYLGVSVGVVGVGTIILDPGTTGQFSPVGIALIFGAVFAAVGYTLSLRQLSPRYRALTVAKLQSLIALPLILVLAIAFEGVPASAPSPGTALNVLFLGIFPSSLAFVFLNRGIRDLGVSRANVFINLVPVFTALLAWILLGETFTPRKMIGMLVVLAGVSVVQLSRKR